MSGDSGKNGWSEWSRHVLAELKRSNTNYDSLLLKVQTMEVETAKSLMALQVKSGVWGAIAGLIPVILFLLYKAIIEK